MLGGEETWDCPDSSSGKLAELPKTRGSNFLGLSKDNATVLFRAHVDRED